MAKLVERVKDILQTVFEEKYLYKKIPLVISSGLNWPAFKWTPNYFKQLFPNKTVYLESYYYTKIKDKGTVQATHIDKLSMQEAIEHIYSNKEPNVKHYLCQKSIHQEFPELTQDFTKPIWMNDEPATTNLWFGEAGNATPLHFDYSHNFLVQIYGRKHIRLFAPEDTKNLYRHTPDTKGPPHLSQIFDIDNYNYDKYPNFKKATAYEVMLFPGETLFIPAGWWHDVRSLDHAISINFWWKPNLNECLISQIMPISAYKLFEINRFNDMYNFFSDFKDFKNDYDTAKYCLKQKVYWLAALFLANFAMDKLRAVGILFNVPLPLKNIIDDIKKFNMEIFLVNKKFALPSKTLSLMVQVLSQAKSEKNDSLDTSDLINLLEEVQKFTFNIKNMIRKCATSC